jgi:hypothetical protein
MDGDIHCGRNSNIIPHAEHAMEPWDFLNNIGQSLRFGLQCKSWSKIGRQRRSDRPLRIQRAVSLTRGQKKADGDCLPVE